MVQQLQYVGSLKMNSIADGHSYCTAPHAILSRDYAM